MELWQSRDTCLKIDSFCFVTKVNKTAPINANKSTIPTAKSRGK